MAALTTPRGFVLMTAMSTGPRQRLLLSSMLLAAIAAFPAEGRASSFRAVGSYSDITYAGTVASRVYENSFIYKPAGRWSVLLTGYRDERAAMSNTIVTVGAARSLDRLHYAEARYGRGTGFDGNGADYAAVSIHRETADSYATIEYLFSAYPDYHSHQLSPAVKYRALPPLWLWAKYFLSYDSTGSVNHAIWTEAEVRPAARFALTAGYTSGNRLYSPAYESALGKDAGVGFWSYIGGAKYEFSSRFCARYVHETTTRSRDLRDVKNTIVADVRF